MLVGREDLVQENVGMPAWASTGAGIEIINARVSPWNASVPTTSMRACSGGLPLPRLPAPDQPDRNPFAAGMVAMGTPTRW